MSRRPSSNESRVPGFVPAWQILLSSLEKAASITPFFISQMGLRSTLVQFDFLSGSQRSSSGLFSISGDVTCRLCSGASFQRMETAFRRSHRLVWGCYWGRWTAVVTSSWNHPFGLQIQGFCHETTNASSLRSILELGGENSRHHHWGNIWWPLVRLLSSA